MNNNYLLTSFPLYTITIPDNAINYHGFLLWRHDTNEATCIAYKSADGSLRAIAIKDAKFRSVQKFGTYGIESSLQNFQSTNKYGNWYFDSSGLSVSDKSPMPDYVNQDNIYDSWSSIFIFDRSAKYNTNVWLTFKDVTDSEGFVSVPAITWCRSQNILGYPCDLPNQYQTIVIWVCGDKLDEMDPTANTYPMLKLGYTATGWPGYGRCQQYNGVKSCNIYSSTEYSRYSVRDVYYNGNCGGSSYSYKHTAGTVVPILEISLSM